MSRTLARMTVLGENRPLRNLEKVNCSEAGCSAPAIARELCPRHYDKRKRAGTLPPSKSKGPLFRVKASLSRTALSRLKRLALERGLRVPDVIRLAVDAFLDRPQPVNAEAESPGR